METMGPAVMLATLQKATKDACDGPIQGRIWVMGSRGLMGCARNVDSARMRKQRMLSGAKGPNGTASCEKRYLLIRTGKVWKQHDQNHWTKWLLKAS